MILAASAPHRGEAFAACRAAVEALKVEVPIWKKSFLPMGKSGWGRAVKPTVSPPVYVWESWVSSCAARYPALGSGLPAAVLKPIKKLRQVVGRFLGSVSDFGPNRKLRKPRIGTTGVFTQHLGNLDRDAIRNQRIGTAVENPHGCPSEPLGELRIDIALQIKQRRFFGQTDERRQRPHRSAKVRQKTIRIARRKQVRSISPSEFPVT